MDSKKYVGMDVHQATISIAVRDSVGKLVMESIIETKASPFWSFCKAYAGVCG
jgi:hypothetical protein